jgi:hypothetical protein
MSTNLDDLEDIEDNTEVQDIELDDIEIEVVEPEFSRGEADKGKPIAAPDTEDEEITDDELARYDVSVQKRIKSLHARNHAERRAKELALKEAAAAIEFGKMMKERLATERDQRLQYTRAAVSSGRSSLEQETKGIMQELREAKESGDFDKEVLLQTKLNTVVQQLNGLPAQEVLDRDIETERARPLPELPSQAAPDEHPDTQANIEAWRAKNTWFDTDPELRQVAIDAQNLLVARFGMQIGSKEILDKISNMVRSGFSDRTGVAPVVEEPKPAPKAPAKSATPMPVIRSAPNGKRVVRLSQDQINAANDMGVSLKAYAAEYARLYPEGE